MQQEDYEIEISATREAVWQVLEDAKSWHRWNTYIEYAHLNGNLTNGINGSFKVSTQKLGGINPAFLYFIIKNSIAYASFTIRIRLFLCTLNITYTLIEDNNHTKVRCSVRLCGILSGHYQKKHGAFTKSAVGSTLGKLKSTVEALKFPRY